MLSIILAIEIIGFIMRVKGRVDMEIMINLVRLKEEMKGSKLVRIIT
jgi:hypothetical protein